MAVATSMATGVVGRLTRTHRDFNRFQQRTGQLTVFGVQLQQDSLTRLN